MKIKKNIFLWLLCAMGIILALAVSAQSLIHVLGLEKERVSPDPDAVPLTGRKDLPQPKDMDGKRNVFLFIDQSIQGRVVEMQIPEGYVSLSGRKTDRYATAIGFSMLLPDLKNTTDPESIEKLRKNKNIILDEQIEIQIGSNSLENLTYSASRILAAMFYAKKEFPWIIYSDIEPAPGFSQGIRENNTIIVENINSHEFIKDFHIAWVEKQKPSKFMMCYPYQPRPTCNFEEYDPKRKKVYNISISFHYKYLPKLPEILRAVEEKIDTFIVKVHPANFKE